MYLSGTACAMDRHVKVSSYKNIPISKSTYTKDPEEPSQNQVFVCVCNRLCL